MIDACDVWKSSTGLSSHIHCLITQIANEHPRGGRRRKNYDETTPYQGRAQNTEIIEFGGKIIAYVPMRQLHCICC